MNSAFEITEEDVENVLVLNKKSINTLYVKSCFAILDFDLIEKAAYGNDLDEQTKYAYEEIEKQLKVIGEIK
jgi:hypothetical protein